MKQTVQHYNVWKAFNQHIYRKTLTNEDLLFNGNEKYVEDLHVITGDSKAEQEVGVEPILRKCVFLEKGGQRYILPSIWKRKLPMNVAQYKEGFLKQSETTIHKYITKPLFAKITPKKTMSLKKLLSQWNPIEHSDEKTWTFLKLQSIATSYKGGKFRLCGEPSSGKNSNDVILSLILNNIVRIGKPTLAKLETLFYYNQKVLPDEITSLKPVNVREIEPFFLVLGDESPTMNKHSMAQNKDLNEIDLTQSSCIFTYNEVHNVRQGCKFFDDIWQNIDAIDSRYPAFLIEGTITSSLPKLNMTQANKIMLENYEFLRTLSENISYYVCHGDDELHNYDRSKIELKGRHLTNTECLYDFFDIYSDTQEEFDGWIQWLQKCYHGYKTMITRYKQGITLQDDFLDEQQAMLMEDVE